MDTNEILKEKFQKLHKELVGQNLSGVVDRLFAAGVMSAESVEDLNVCVAGSAAGVWSTAKSRMLMTTLHRSHHPTAFIQLRVALSELDSVKWIVDELDKLEVDDKFARDKVTADSVQCQCPNCGRLHASATEPTAGQSPIGYALVAHGSESLTLSNPVPTLCCLLFHFHVTLFIIVMTKYSGL